MLAAARADLAPTPVVAVVPQRHPQNNPGFWQRFRFPHVLSAPTIGVLLLLGAIALGSQYQLGEQRDRVQILERQNAGLSTHLESIRIGQETYGEQAVVYSLSTPSENDDASGLLLSGPDHRSALISLWNMADTNQPLSVIFESSEYGSIAVGTVVVDEAGVGSIEITLPDSFDSYTAVKIVRGNRVVDTAETNDEHVVLQSALGRVSPQETSVS